MSNRSTKGAQESPNSWKRSALRVWTVRSVVHLVPLVGSWLAVRSVSDYLFRPDGIVGLALWALQALFVAAVSATAIERVSRRLLPLAFMFELTLDFPDKAPSRFKVAMKSGTVRKLSDSSHMEKMLARSDGSSTAETALAMVAAMSRHDRLTRGHVERVRAYADVIAEQMGLSDADRNGLAWGVLLHDIGKLAVPSEILNKNEELTDAEWEVLQSHPLQGERLIAPLTGFLGDWALAASQHHERWDGDGYPHGLAGKQISLAGRITAVADAYDVITAKRSYKKPMSHTAAREELVRCSGGQFDPEVVRAMLAASVGNRWKAGPFAWLAEVPGVVKIGQAVTSVPGAVAASGMAATVMVAPTLPNEFPQNLAFIETTDSPTETSLLPADAATLLTVVFDEPGLAIADAATTTETTETVEDVPAPTTETVSNSSSTDTSTVATTSTSNSTTTETSTTTSSTTTTTSPTTTTTSPTTTSTLPAAVLLLWLSNPGTEDTTSSPELELGAIDHDTWHIHNYDTDRNGDKGLTIKKDGAGLNGSDLTKLQDWVYTFDTETHVSGEIDVAVWVRPDTNNKEDVGIEGRLELCTPICTELGSDSWTRNQLGWWKQADLYMGSTDFTAQPGDTLRLRIVVPDDLSDVDLRLAYDVSWADSGLVIG